MKEEIEFATSQKYSTFEAIEFIKRDNTIVVRVRLDQCIIINEKYCGIYTLIVHNIIIMTLVFAALLSIAG